MALLKIINCGICGNEVVAMNDICFECYKRKERLKCRQVIDAEVGRKITVWGYGDVTYTPELHIQLSEHIFKIGDKVRVTIERLNK